MGWLIGREQALSDPVNARKKALELFEGLEDVEDAERLLMPILLDAVLIVEAYRGARHQISLLPDLTRSVDALVRELRIVERTRQWETANS